jgi:hypothetical protein
MSEHSIELEIINDYFNNKYNYPIATNDFNIFFNFAINKIHKISYRNIVSYRNSGNIINKFIQNIKSYFNVLNRENLYIENSYSNTYLEYLDECLCEILISFKIIYEYIKIYNKINENEVKQCYLKFLEECMKDLNLNLKYEFDTNISDFDKNLRINIEKYDKVLDKLNCNSFNGGSDDDKYYEMKYYKYKAKIAKLQNK